MPSSCQSPAWLWCQISKWCRLQTGLSLSLSKCGNLPLTLIYAVGRLLFVALRPGVIGDFDWYLSVKTFIRMLSHSLPSSPVKVLRRPLRSSASRICLFCVDLWNFGRAFIQRWPWMSWALEFLNCSRQQVDFISLRWILLHWVQLVVLLVLRGSFVTEMRSRCHQQVLYFSPLLYRTRVIALFALWHFQLCITNLLSQMDRVDRE